MYDLKDFERACQAFMLNPIIVSVVDVLSLRKQQLNHKFEVCPTVIGQGFRALKNTKSAAKISKEAFLLE